ncbi:MAG: ATP-binding cassette domain-containing protein [Symbiobacteriaceae bacterium]|nr:ATP-binding cassette domain-containing protein [Symbiobacteriaceae bacterium]
MHSGLFSKVIGYVRAVDDVSFIIHKGETLGLVGESGCGKTTTGKSILRLNPYATGEVVFEGEDIMKLPAEAMRKRRGEMQIIFQDPYSSLNPRLSVKDIIAEPLVNHGIGTAQEREQRVMGLLETVGLSPLHSKRFPHEFSGGQRQRIGIARALALNPKLIVCDEPVSALDVSIQSQILNLLAELQKELGLTYLFIAHGLAVVKHISDRIGVMYLGKLVEIATSDELHQNPLHPYTKALLSANPVPDPTVKIKRILLEGDVPNPANPPSGCRFHPRCRECMIECSELEPDLVEVSPGHLLACHLIKTGFASSGSSSG